MFAEMFDGLRGFYARAEGADSAPAFSAAMLLAFMCSVNTASLIIIFDLAVHGRLVFVSWMLGHKMIVIAGSVVIGIIHVAAAKRSGLYNRSGPALHTNWAQPFRWYCLITAILFGVGMVLAFSARTT